MTAVQSIRCPFTSNKTSSVWRTLLVGWRWRFLENFANVHTRNHFGASFDLSVNCAALVCSSRFFVFVCFVFNVANGWYSYVQLFKLQLFSDYFYYLHVTDTAPISIADGAHIFFILCCAAVLVATFSFIGVIACRPRHHSRSRVRCLGDTSLRLQFRCFCIRETRWKWRQNRKYVYLRNTFGYFGVCLFVCFSTKLTVMYFYFEK